MYMRRKNDNNNERRSLGGGLGNNALACRSSSNSCGSGSATGTSSTTSSKLFQPGARILIQRAPMLQCLSIPARLQKKFQRPMLKRRAYNGNADDALRRSSLGQRKRMDGMAKLMARAGRGLTYKAPQRDNQDGDNNNGTDDSDGEDENAKEPDRPFEPLRVWQSPHNGGEPKGIPPQRGTEIRCDEYGIEQEVLVLKPAPDHLYSKHDVFVPPVLAKFLRDHQREGVSFMYSCVMGLKDYRGNGCILADDMGLGKTLQSVTLIYTLLKTGITANGAPTAKRVIVVCPCSLVKNWENEFTKWLGEGAVKTLAIAEADRATVQKNLDAFVRTKIFNVLIASYECIRAHVGRLAKYKDCCDLLVCDEAHRLKNRDNQTSRALDSLPVKRRVLLTGTPMQNDLQEFFAMVDFTNSGILGTQEEFRKHLMLPILRGREPDATEADKKKMLDCQNEMSAIVNEFILRRTNTLNAEHLPPKLVQVVCCNLTEIQQNMYQHLINSKDTQHILQGKQVNCLGSIQMLMKLCNHPSLIVEDDDKPAAKSGGRRAASKNIKYNEDEKETAAAPGASGVAKFLPFVDAGGRRMNAPVYPEWSGKMFVLYRLMKEMRKPGNGNDKIVIVSNYTQTLDLIGRMCRENSWGFCRLDGSIGMKKRQKMVDDFNDPSSSLVAFLLSSKAGGCGLNLIGGNRLVLFDPDWNPAVDKQAAARCWRDGQKKRCFTYRFLATGTVEEKIFQRQLSKEGLQSVVDDKEQVNALSTKDLRNLFKLRNGTPSDTHDKLRCERCEIIHDNDESDAIKVLPKKLRACRELLDEMIKREEASYFLKPIVPQDHGVSAAEYEKIVKQPMDFGTIQKRIAQSLATQQPKAVQDESDAQTTKSTKGKQPSAASSYTNVSTFSKDVNRIFSNCLKVWEPEKDDIADAARQLQAWWLAKWTELVPTLMSMKADEDEKKSDDEARDEKDELLTSTAAMMNERGDNYQEQLGMPEEENMRNWSHHHSTDTVDDPVFRAAMRGYDTVSFVFGLEVTWSLIQQRQQEQDEREAMMELQAIQEMNEAEEEDDAGDGNEADETMNQKEDTATEEEEDKNAVSKEDEDDDANETEDDADKSAETELEVDGNGHDTEEKELPAVDSPGSSSASTETDDEEVEEESESEDEEMGEEVEAPSPPVDKENKAPSAVWSCAKCTYGNEASERTCQMCGGLRPAQARKKRRT